MTTIFSHSINGNIPGTFVYRDDLCVAFMSINPLADGHVLVVPIEEVDHWVDASPELSAHLFAVSHKISLALATAFPCERVGLIIAANAAQRSERDTLESHAAKIIAAL